MHLSGINKVYAQENTPTNYPLWVTPTPYNVNTTCPEGQPGGWGTITPNPVWLNYCSHCITPQSNYNWPTYEWGENPLITTTPTIPVYSGEISCKRITDGTYIPANYLSILGQSGTKYTHNFKDEFQFLPDVDNIEYVVGFYYRLNYSIGPWYDGYTNNISVRVTSQELCSIRVEVVEGEGLGINQIINYGETVNIPFETYSLGTGTNFDKFTKFNIYVPNNCDSRDDLEFRVYYNNSFSITGNWYDVERHLYWTQSEIDNWVIPTPVEPTPSPNSDYCSVVNGDGSGPGDDDDDFELPGIWIGGTDCFTFGGINLNLDWLEIFFGEGNYVINIPGVSICFTSIEFGTLSLFGIDINMDALAAAMAGVVLFRFVTRS